MYKEKKLKEKEKKREEKKLGRKQKRRRMERVKKFKRGSRWLPNSAFQTYFGKPAFENYGRNNLNPLFGGPVYGNYMKSHNINPERLPNHPQYK